MLKKMIWAYFSVATGVLTYASGYNEPHPDYVANAYLAVVGAAVLPGSAMQALYGHRSPALLVLGSIAFWIVVGMIAKSMGNRPARPRRPRGSQAPALPAIPEFIEVRRTARTYYEED